MTGALDSLLQRPDLWRGRQGPAVSVAAVPTGWPGLDRALPGGGWPQEGLVEVLARHAGIGEVSLLLPALARLVGQGRRTAWVDPPHVPYAPALMGGDTDMVAALRAAKPADGLGIKIVLLSDGEPNDREATLAEARRFKTHIDTIYIGPERETRGREFLQELARKTGGSYQKTAQPGMLAQPIAALLQAPSPSA